MNYIFLVVLCLLNFFSNPVQAESFGMQRYLPPSSGTAADSAPNVYRYNSTNFSSDTLLLFDQALQQKIFLTNFTSSGLRIVFFDKDYKIKKSFRLPSKSDISPYQFQMLEFYPTRVDGETIYPGAIIIKTVRGDIVIDLQNPTAQFLIYTRFLFEDMAEEIPVKEIKKL